MTAHRRLVADYSWFDEPEKLRDRAADYEKHANESPCQKLAGEWRSKASILRRRAAGYRTLTATNGWKQISVKRLRAGQMIAAIAEKGEQLKMIARLQSPGRRAPRNDSPTYRKQAADRQFGLFLPAVVEQPVKRASRSRKPAA